MDIPVPANKNLTLEEVRDQFKHWRKSREKRSAIPDALWQAAILLFPKYSFCQISKALRLNYTDLKHRVEAHRSTFEQSAVPEPAFVELGLSGPIHPAECIVEMEDQKGAKMRMHFKGEAGLDLLELGKAFWRKRP
jgi:hypothetical protein